MVLLLIVTVYGGYLFPLPSVVMSWRVWLASNSIVPENAVRRVVSTVSLILLTALIPLWAYAAIREVRNDYSYVYRSAQIGRWSSLFLLVISIFAKGKLRRYLLLGAVGLFFFFAISIGELP